MCYSDYQYIEWMKAQPLCPHVGEESHKPTLEGFLCLCEKKFKSGALK